MVLLLAPETDAQNFRVVKQLSTSSQYAGGELLLCGNFFYGLAGGAYSYGGIFRMDTNGANYTLIKSFSAPVYDGTSNYTNYDGATPLAGLVTDGTKLFGSTYSGGLGGKGTLFSIKTNGTAFTVLKHFTGTDGKAPYAELLLDGNFLYGTTAAGGVSNRGTVFRINTDGSDFAVLKNLTTGEGMLPLRGLVLSGDTLYGAAYQGGISNYGTIFSLKTNGDSFTVLKRFSGEDAICPHSRLALSGNILFGTTDGYGIESKSVVFRINTDGSDYAVIKSFSPTDPVNGTNSDGSYLRESLVLAGKTLYGATRWGGNAGNGVLFAMGLDGNGYFVLKHFSATDTSGKNTDGAIPWGVLTLADGTLYGTTQYGGTYGIGTVFAFSLVPRILTANSSFGIHSNTFGLYVSGYSNQTVIVETCTNLGAFPWLAVSTNTLGQAPRYLGVPLKTNAPSEFYRVRSF